MTEGSSMIEGKVAQIISEREIAINKGSAQGVKKGMRFAVLAATPQEVFDPDTGELLDTVDRVKVSVQATEVRERITICSTYRKVRIPGGALSTAATFSSLLNPPREVPETIRIEDSSLPAPLSPEESYIKIGDRVRQIEDPIGNN